MSWNWGENLKNIIDSNDNIFLRFAGIIAKNYYTYFTQMLAWAMSTAFLLVIIPYFLRITFGLASFEFQWLQFVTSCSFFYILSKMYGRKSSWFLWIASTVPYILIPFLLYSILGFIGLIISAYLAVSMVFFVQEILVRESNILEAYINSIRLTWRYNLRLVAFILIPWLALTSIKFTFFNAINIPDLGSYVILIYWLASVIFLPWFVFAYAIFYDFLQLEKGSEKI